MKRRKPRNLNNEWVIRQIMRHLEANYPTMAEEMQLKSIVLKFYRHQKHTITCPPLSRKSFSTGGKLSTPEGGKSERVKKKKPFNHRERILAGAPKHDQPGVPTKQLASMCGCPLNTRFYGVLARMVDVGEINEEDRLYNLPPPKK